MARKVFRSDRNYQIAIYALPMPENKIQDGIWIIDADGRTSYVNERMAEILGVSCSEVLGQSSFDFVFPDDIGAARHLFQARKIGHVSPFQFKLRRKDGSAISVDVQGAPMFTETGEFKGVVGTFVALD
jgi:PAS domain S-box-containing protein